VSRPAPRSSGPAEEDPNRRATMDPTIADDESVGTGEATTDRTPSEDGGRHRAAKEKEKKGGPLGFLRELPGLILIAFALALLIKTFLVQAFFIPSQSMVPTLRVGDRVLVNKLVYDFGDIQRGDIIVFRNPNLEDPDRNLLQDVWNWITEGLGFSSDPTRDFIKRVVGLPGETIEVRNGRVSIDGRRLKEPYVSAMRDRSDYAPHTVPAGHVFVMGDNRPNSQDSRSALGFIPEDKIVGKAFVLLWPPSRIEWLSDD
jgi:signal peptidase I